MVDRDARLEARHEIVNAANNVAAELRQQRPYRMRHLQRCVHVVKQRKAVKAETLLLAGFRVF